jgi:hypothetical protein
MEKFSVVWFAVFSEILLIPQLLINLVVQYHQHKMWLLKVIHIGCSLLLRWRKNLISSVLAFYTPRSSHGKSQVGQVSALNRVQKRATKFANNINESGWETLAQRRLIARICALFKAYTEERTWKAIGNRLLKPCYLSRGDHNRKIRTRKERTEVGKYSFVNRTITSWNQLPPSLLASFPCKLNTFRKRVRNVVTRKGFQVGLECK